MRTAGTRCKVRNRKDGRESGRVVSSYPDGHLHALRGNVARFWGGCGMQPHPHPLTMRLCTVGEPACQTPVEGPRRLKAGRAEAVTTS